MTAGEKGDDSARINGKEGLETQGYLLNDMLFSEEREGLDLDNVKGDGIITFTDVRPFISCFSNPSGEFHVSGHAYLFASALNELLKTLRQCSKPITNDSDDLIQNLVPLPPFAPSLNLHTLEHSRFQISVSYIRANERSEGGVKVAMLNGPPYLQDLGRWQRDHVWNRPVKCVAGLTWGTRVGSVGRLLL